MVIEILTGMTRPSLLTAASVAMVDVRVSRMVWCRRGVHGRGEACVEGRLMEEEEEKASRQITG